MWSRGPIPQTLHSESKSFWTMCVGFWFSPAHMCLCLNSSHLVTFEIPRRSKFGRRPLVPPPRPLCPRFCLAPRKQAARARGSKPYDWNISQDASLVLRSKASILLRGQHIFSRAGRTVHGLGSAGHCPLLQTAHPYPRGTITAVTEPR